jgi:DNA-binding NtrC family response regulator
MTSLGWVLGESAALVAVRELHGHSRDAPGGRALRLRARCLHRCTTGQGGELFQTANGGTLLLHEVGLLPVAMQAKLLKVIEERSVRRLGSTRSEPLDVCIVAATSENLPEAARAGRFRVDLYHRLAVVTLTLPPLRARGRDVLLLAEHFLARACDEYGLPVKRLTDDAESALMAYGWPGNVRELANVLERAALLGRGTGHYGGRSGAVADGAVGVAGRGRGRRRRG